MKDSFLEGIQSDAEALSLPQGRRPGKPGHQKAVRYIVQRMSEEGLSPFTGSSFKLPYTIKGNEYANLAGVVEGTVSDAMPLLLGAHYDSAIDGPCSDDNAVSVALILNLIGGLRESRLRRSVLVVFFDAEEEPWHGTEAMGSVRFVEDHCRGMDFACALILDAIAHDFEVLVPVLDRFVGRIREFIFLLGSESHSLLPGILERQAGSVKGLRPIATLNRYIPDTSDHMAFRKARQPYLFVSRGRGKFTHTLRDDLAWISWNGVERVGEFTVNLLRELDLSPMERRRIKVDPWRTEAALMRRAAGLLLHPALMMLGNRSPFIRSRKDLDKVAARLSEIVSL